MPSARDQAFSDFLVRESVQIELGAVAINLLIAAFLAFLLGRLYIRFGQSASDRRAFASQFVLLSVTTALIIVVVKSSLALSLGLVGALSIVRFRSAVREHEELAFLFVSIAFGLCIGADQVGLALLGFGIITLVLVLRGLIGRKVRHEHLFVKVHGPRQGDNPLGDITEILTRHCSTVKLKRCDVSDETIEAAFLAEFPSLTHLTQAQCDLQGTTLPMTVSIIDGDGIV